VDGITIEVNNTVPTFVTIKLRSAIGTEQSEETVSPLHGVSNITWSATDEIQTRSELIKRLASSINISLSGHLDSSDVFSVVEIHVNRRDNCFGNADNISGGECYCLGKTHTTGQDCGTCEAGYYRRQNKLDCPFECNCTSAPGIKTEGQCNQDGGGCLCKDGVEGYHCDSCKHLYYNLTESNADGCKPCSSCDQTGSQSCNDVGTCLCKNNVINSQCNQCASNTYGLHNLNFEGCQNCACNTHGSDPNIAECDKENGNCTCKQYVTGRKCDLCKSGYKNLDFANSRGCDDCTCNKVGSQDITSCDQTSGQCVCLYPVRHNLQCNPMFDSENLEPAFGPVAGGTEVTIRGRFFKHNVNNTKVEILVNGENKYLTVTIFEEQRLQFITNSIRDSGLYNIMVQWPKSVGQDEEDFSKTFQFTFKVNPVVTEPMNATVFRSGGCYVKIKGSNFESVFEPRLIAHIGSTEVSDKTCINIGGNMINCPSPDLRNYTGVSTVSYGLQLDGLNMYRNLGNSFPSEARITVIDDPIVHTNNDLTIDTVFSNNLIIKGSNLDKACEDSFEIKLGDDVCPIQSKTSTEVKCTPVIVFPGESKEVELKVIIGNFQSTVGVVKIKSFWATWQFIIISASVGGCILLILIIFIIVKCYRRCQSNKLKYRKSSASTERNNQFDSIVSPIVAEQTSSQPRRNNYTDMSGLPLSTIESEESMVEKFLHKLDSTLRDEVHSSLSKCSVIKPGLRCMQKGAEIRMIDGKFQEGPFIGQNATIKTLVAEFKDFGTDLLPRWIGTGIAETLRFRDCHQDNLHRSCGITVDKSRFYVLYPATQRILKEHLRDRKQEFTSFSLIEICQKIAEAMDYLSSNNIIHRDVATRNCIVCPGDIVKISDAAFSWSLFPDEYMYDSERERWLPVRWMAQDCHQFGFYSTATDVWSYGVLMWEVMSRGVLLPYFDIEKNEDIKDHVISGFRLGKPETVPDEMYTLMMSCWETNHSKRPAFVRIIERLIDILNPPESPTLMYQNQQHEELPEYGNVPDDRPKLPSRANMPAKNGDVNFGST
ncbi:hepatocyte growth factor receptor-like, partial [Mizuhopecten yessoensis]|uniref:hepatocyte growth factor receptor-like n=1 Tax=Mizuhopecten yessoensis TaxID=6573 RepID=UPI000B45A3FA